MTETQADELAVSMCENYGEPMMVVLHDGENRIAAGFLGEILRYTGGMTLVSVYTPKEPGQAKVKQATDEEICAFDLGRQVKRNAMAHVALDAAVESRFTDSFTQCPGCGNGQLFWKKHDGTLSFYCRTCGIAVSDVRRILEEKPR